MKQILFITGLLSLLLSGCEQKEMESDVYLQDIANIQLETGNDIQVIDGILRFPNYDSYYKVFTSLYKMSSEELLDWDKQISYSSMFLSEMSKKNYIEMKEGEEYEEEIENEGELDDVRKALYSDKGLLVIGDTIYKVKGEYIYKIPTSSEEMLSVIDKAPEKFEKIRFRHTIPMIASVLETSNTPRMDYEDAVIQGGGEARTPLFKVSSKRREHIKFIAEIQKDDRWCFLKFGLRGRAQKKKIGIWGNTFNDEMLFGEGYGIVTVNNTIQDVNIIAPRVDNKKESYSTSLGKYALGPDGQIRSCTIDAYFYCCKRQEAGVHNYKVKFNINQ